MAKQAPREKKTEVTPSFRSELAGEPLATIEVEVTAKLAKRISQKSPALILKVESDDAEPLVLLGTTYPEELPPAPRALPAFKALQRTTPLSPYPWTWRVRACQAQAVPTPATPAAPILEKISPEPFRSQPSFILLETSYPEELASLPPEPTVKISPPALDVEPVPVAPAPMPIAIEAEAEVRDIVEAIDEAHPISWPEEVAPAETPSLFRSRAFAALIDVSVACSFFVLGLLFFPDPPRVAPFIFAALYLLTKDSLGILNGQSIGKKVMRIRAVNRAHRSLAGNYRAGILRNFSWCFAPLELAILYVREDEVTKGKRLGDDWAKTEVIAEEERSPHRSKWLP